MTNNTVDSAMTLTVTTATTGKELEIADNNVSLILNASAGTPTYNLENAMSLAALTITAGILDTTGSNHALTVTGAVSGAGPLTGNASTISMGNFAMSGTYNATTGSTIITDRAGAGYQLSCAVADIVHNDGTFDFRGSSGGASDIRLNGASDGTNGLHDVIINASGRTVSLNSYALTIDGNLTITAGTFSTSGSNYGLTVTEHVSVTGTLTGNASAISVGSMIVNASGTYTATSGTTTITSETNSHAFRVSGSGTLANSDGTILITTPAETRIKMNGTGNIHTLKVNHASCVVFTHTDSAGITLEGDLIIIAGTLNTSEQGGSDKNLTVAAGETDIQAAGTLTGNASAISLKALTIRDGGTYNGTSGTTTITGEQGGYAWKNDETDGTGFVHNNGIVKITGTDNTHLIETTFYDLTVDANGQNVFLRPSSGTAMTIANNFTLIAGIVGKNSHTHTLTVTGLCNVGDGSGSANTAHLDTSTSGTAITNFGALTILSDGKYTQSTTTNVGSIRNVGGTIA